MPGLSILDLLLIYDMKAGRTDFSGTSTPLVPLRSLDSPPKLPFRGVLCQESLDVGHFWARPARSPGRSLPVNYLTTSLA